ncbi:sure-like protein [Atractiella rhizophila]|nr:sure-like protein [Atractiella rhizophila]
MHPNLFYASALVLSAVAAPTAGSTNFKRQNGNVKIAIGDDDGWATSFIRTAYNTLTDAGFPSIISAPAENKSGSSSLDLPATPLTSAGQFGTIPAGAPATGSDPNDSRINYVNSFPVTAIKFGIKTVAPRELGGKPDLVITGPNVGSNLGIVTQFSGTVGAATEGVKEGIPAIAFSAAGGVAKSFADGDDPIADVYAGLTLKVVQTLVDSGAPFLPSGVGLNVNFPDITDACASVDDFKFVLSRVNIDINPFTDDVQQCGTNHLPTESSVIDSGNCRVSISGFDSSDKFDLDKARQAVVRDKFASILSCIDD